LMSIFLTTRKKKDAISLILPTGISIHGFLYRLCYTLKILAELGNCFNSENSLLC